MENEIWKSIEFYEDLYEVSNFGFIKSMRRNLILKPKIDRSGYLWVDLCKNKGHKHKGIHRLVAEAFIPNPENKPEVNHKKCIKTDNRASELEWVTQAENDLHAKLMGVGGRKEVIDTLNGKVYSSIKAAARDNNMRFRRLSDKLKGRRRNNTTLTLRDN